MKRILNKVFSEASNRWVEIVGLTVAIACLAVYLVVGYSLKPYSDPHQWYCFGKNFLQCFGEKDIAYGFPLVIAISISVVGPFFAFLVNIPIILILSVAVYFFAKRHWIESVSRSEPCAVLCGAIALLVFVFIEKSMLLYLTSPYRDPLSFLLIITGFLAIVRFRFHSEHSLIFVVVSAASLAFACSVRETSILVLLPLFVYAIIEKWRHRELPFLMPILIFACVFGVVCIPFIVQNFLVSGNVFVPAQASNIVADTGVMLKIVEAGNFAIVIPMIMTFLLKRATWPICILFAIGVIGAVKRKNTIVLSSFIACIVYLLFYGGYDRKIVERYLMVIDFFAIPIISFGAVYIIQGFFGLVAERFRFDKNKAVIVLTCFLFVATSVLSLWSLLDMSTNFHLKHAREFTDDINNLLPSGARVLSERPLHGIMKCFTHVNTVVLKNLTKSKELSDPDLPEVLETMVNDSGDAIYFVNRTIGNLRFMLGEFDLVEKTSFRTSKYGLKNVVRAEEFSVSRIVPWSQKSIERTVDWGKVEGGKKILVFDAGSLSKYNREFAKLRFNGVLLDDHVSDNINHYIVDVGGTNQHVVHFESDMPVPSEPFIDIISLDAPLRIGFARKDVGDFSARGSSSFVFSPRFSHAFIDDSGMFNASTLVVSESLFVYVCKVSLMRDGFRSVRVETGDDLLFADQISHGWQRISFVSHSSMASKGRTPLMWVLDPLKDGEEPNSMIFRSMTIYRLDLKDIFRVDVGEKGSNPMIIDGLYRRESRPGFNGMSWRWTGKRARIRIVLKKGVGSVAVIVGLFDENRPAGSSEPKPSFILNGAPCVATFSNSDVHGWKYVEATLIVDAKGLSDDVNILEIISPTWVPSEYGMGTDDRELGIMLRSVKAERLNSEL